MKLSILIPCYNEERTIQQTIRHAWSQDLGIEKEIIVVDDGSTDGTREKISEIAQEVPLLLIEHESNQGKGAALVSAIPKVTGEMSIIQDADMEYSPNEYAKLIAPLLSGEADIVYGTRYETNRKGYLTHYLFNRLMSRLTANATRLVISDVLTGHKVFRSVLLKQTPLTSRGFSVDMEITQKITSRHSDRFREIPINYTPRTYREGKKIGLRDSILILWSLIKFLVKKENMEQLDQST